MTTHTSTDTQNSFFSRAISINWEFVLFLLIFVAALFTRFHILGDRVMSHDESLHTRFSYDLYADGNFEHTPLMHGPILFHAVAASYALFGDSDFSARIYPALLSVILVMMPLLFRRWLGRWGTILASLMLLISPLILYYGRYIRHDTPSIVSALLMMWAIMMYLSGPDNQRRRAHWLYIIAVAMVWNLGSKETAFIYIAIIGIFLAIYFFVRLFQYLAKRPGKAIFYNLMIGMFLGGVMSLGMYIILDIIQFDMLGGDKTFAMLTSYEQSMYFIWSAIAVASVVAVALGTLFWVYRNTIKDIPWAEVAVVIGIALATCFLFIVAEELSHTTPTATTASQPAAPVIPGEEGAGGTNELGISWTPMIAIWAVAIGGFIFLFFTRRKEEDYGVDYDIDEKDKYGRGFWGTLDLFPEADLLIVIGTLILPWATALIPYAMGGTAADHAAIASSLPSGLLETLRTYIPRMGTEQQIGMFLLHFWAWLPLMALSIAIGLMWNWKRWLIASGIFHLLFAFFFTTIFTNIRGLATGMVYSLGYWLEQQGVRRGSQPQYYYLLIIMPFYEFLPVIGGIGSMFAGMGVFWKWRKNEHESLSEQRAALMLESDGDQVSSDNDDEANELLGELADANNQQPNQTALATPQAERLTHLPFLIFFSWLAVLNLVGYSLAGEKMPWLGTHLTMPLIFLTAWFFGRIIERIDFAKFRERGWIVSLVLIVATVGLFRTITPLIMGIPPFSGLSTAALEATYEWLAALLVTGVAFAVIRYLAQQVGWGHVRQLTAVTLFALLSVLTFRSAWMASFINYDYPNEFLVYAHAAPGVKWVLDDIEELSQRITDGDDLKFVYDNEVSWPYSWYFRDYDNVVYVGENPTVQNMDDAIAVVVGAANLSKVEPILEERYIRFDHQRLWWPMQDYFYLNVQRVTNALDLNPSNTQAAQIRKGIFDIWWSRDYTTYGAANEQNYSLENWPVSDKMHFYVRKDYAAQIWEYGIGEGDVANPLDEIEINQCTANWQDMLAVAEMTAPDGMTNPIGVALAPDNTVYVAEEFGHRISTFSSDGQYLGSFGTEGTPTPDMLTFTRPNGIAFDAAGNLYIADTWNYRIQALSPDLEQFASFGQAGSFGFDAPREPVDAFWGPRDVAVDANGRIFVSDTGNKRVRAYQLIDGVAQYITDIGSGGSALGELDEPTGLAVDDEGRLFVADTWNRRISVFTTDGIFLDTYRVRGWYQDQGNRPYLAVDNLRDLLYVTDPDSGRVLVYTTTGDCVGSFGQPAGSAPTLGQFGVASGIAVDSAGFVYVSDSNLGRILKFEPFPYIPPVVEEAAESANADAELDDIIDPDSLQQQGETTEETSE